eukprot:TRINITY_DN1892_c0_g3_i2.p1 TRINITY_DN1892_c0_g3~~TRINITY_DN1892_c0_g3_i2.p1  ORF type:complete len:826 (+),score=283.39 TRINITY_DN1892_c0_g3_i2:183-2660(+)
MAELRASATELRVPASDGLRASASSVGPLTPNNPVGLPPGIEPVSLSAATLKIFNVRIGETVTKEKPYITLSREALLADISSRAILSDFYPLRARIEAYTGSEMLLVYDEEQKFKKNFYLHITQDTTIKEVERLGSNYSDLLQKTKSPSGSRAPSRLGGMRSRAVSRMNAGDKGDERTGWESLGSETEVADENCVRTRELLKLSISRRRMEFGAPCKFVDSDAHDGLVECRQFRNPNFELVRTEQDVAVQAVPVQLEIGVQTSWFGKANSATQFQPYANADVGRDAESADDTLVAGFLSSVWRGLEYSLQQNETIDIFKDDFRDLIEEDMLVGDKSDNQLKEFQSFTDYEFSKDKYISSLDWKPEGKGVVSVACTERMDPDEAPSVAGKVAPSVILVWDFIDPINPQLILEAPSDILQFRYHPRKSNIIVAALVNGQICLWDTTEAQKKVLIQKSKSNVGEDEDIRRTVSVIPFFVASSVEYSHTKPATSIGWLPHAVGYDGSIMRTLPSNEYNYLITTSYDGQVLFWDTTRFINRHELPQDDVLDMSWEPVFRIELFDVVPGPEGGELHIPVVYPLKALLVAFEGHHHLYIGTMQGELLFIDWKDIEYNRAKESIRRTELEHFGAIVSLQPSPFMPEVLVSAGEWSIHIWRDGISRALVSSPAASSQVTCVRWSPTRAAVLFVGKQDGTVDIWDLLDKSHVPSLTQHVCSCVTTMEFLPNKPQADNAQANNQQDTSMQLLAVGDAQGRLHILEVPRNLAQKVGQKTSEKVMLQNFFKREENRVAYVERRRALEAPTAAAGKDVDNRLSTPHAPKPQPELTTADL